MMLCGDTLARKGHSINPRSASLKHKTVNKNSLLLTLPAGVCNTTMQVFLVCPPTGTHSLTSQHTIITHLQSHLIHFLGLRMGNSSEVHHCCGVSIRPFQWSHVPLLLSASYFLPPPGSHDYWQYVSPHTCTLLEQPEGIAGVYI